MDGNKEHAYAIPTNANPIHTGAIESPIPQIGASIILPEKHTSKAKDIKNVFFTYFWDLGTIYNMIISAV